ncbi:MAG: methanogen output domain 1-containing protein [Sumerlaeia bacterium]
MVSQKETERIAACSIEHSDGSFLRKLIGELTQSLQEVVGERECAGFIGIVGTRVGHDINEQYRDALKLQRLNREQVAAVLLDLKRRIGGDFYILEENDRRLVLGNRRCPFGDLVRGRPSLCMMTSSVFGVVAARNLGYAKVDVEKAIARGDSECRVTIYLDEREAALAEGREYFRVETEMEL